MVRTFPITAPQTSYLDTRRQSSPARQTTQRPPLDPTTTMPLQDKSNTVLDKRKASVTTKLGEIQKSSLLGLDSASTEPQHTRQDPEADAKPSPYSFSKIQNGFDGFRQTFTYALRTAKSDKTHFCIGCSSIFLVVFSVAIFVSMMTLAPVIFLGTAEYQSGELDMQLRPRGGNGYTALNYTAIASALEDRPEYQYSTPRYEFMPVLAANPPSCTSYDPSNPTEVDYLMKGPDNTCAPGTGLECFQNVCQEKLEVVAFLLDLEREKECDIGRGWKLPELGQNEVYINSVLADKFDIGAGDYIYLSLSMSSLTTTWRTIWGAVTVNKTDAGSTYKDFEKIDRSNAPFLIRGVYSDPNKYNRAGSSIQYHVILSYAHFLQSTTPYLDSYISSTVTTYTSQHPELLYHNAQSIIFSCENPRYSCYLSTSFDKTATSLLSRASQLIFTLGYDQVEASLPVLRELQGSSLLLQFLGLIFGLVVILLCALAMFLVYSLLMTSVETRTWEMGVLRMVGVTRRGIIILLLVQSLTYAIPAWVFGLSLSQIAYLFVRRLFNSTSGILVAQNLSPLSIVYATLLGLLVPIISSIGPIRHALSNNLRDALDKRHNKVKAVIITIERSRGSTQGLGSIALIGLLLSVFGFLIYYLLPLALVSSNFGLLFNIFFALILGMLFGLVLLAVNIQPLLERTILRFILLFISRFELRVMGKLVQMNLLAHKLRNKKTSTMLSFSLGFIIFLAVNLNIQLKSLEWSRLQDNGAAIQIFFSVYDGNGKPLSMPLIPALETLCANYSDYVRDYAYATYPLFTISNSLQRTSIRNLGQLVDQNQRIYGVSPNFFDIVDPKDGVVSVDSEDPRLTLFDSVTERLYSPRGYNGAVLSTSLREQLALQSWNDTFLQVNRYVTTGLSRFEYHELSPIAYMNSMPVFEASRTTTARTSALLVSFPKFLELGDGEFTRVTQIPISYMFIALERSTPSQVRKWFLRNLRDLVDGSADIRVLDDKLSGIRSSRNLLSTIFQAATVLVMLISLFSLNSAMYINILEQQGEIGILRALGITQWTLFRLYCYEAFCTTLAASFTGSLIGALIAWSMSAQVSLLNNIPIAFEFPWDLVYVVLLCAVISAVLATATPLWKLVARTRVVQQLRA